MCIYLKNISAKFHPNLTWNDRTLSFFEDSHPDKNKKKKNKVSSDMRSDSDLKRRHHTLIHIFIKYWLIFTVRCTSA